MRAESGDVPTSRTTLASRAVFVTAMAFLLYGCTGGLSCGGDAGSCINAYPYPASGISNGTAPVDDGARMRMTQAGLDFLSTHVKDLLIAVAAEDPNNPDVLMISTTEEFDIGYGALGQGDNETHPTEIFLDASDFADSIEMEFIEGAGQGIRIRAVDVPVGLQARHFVDWGLGNAACDLFGTNSEYGGEPWVTGVTMELLIKPRVTTGAECDVQGIECLKIDVEVIDLDVDPRNNFGAGAIELDKPYSACPSDGLGDCSEECSDTVIIIDPNGDNECTGVCGVNDAILDTLAALFGVLENLLGGFLPGLVEGLVRNALADFDGAPIAVADRLNLAELSDNLIPPTSHELGYLAGPTSNAFDVNCPTGSNCDETRGMDFIFKTGLEAAPPEDPEDALSVPHPCVEPLVGVDFADLYGNGEFLAPDAQQLTGELDGVPYHLGVSLAKASVNQALYAVYNAGTLCLELDSDKVHELAGGAFPLSAGTLDLLTEGKLRQFAPPTAPAIVTITPTSPPIFELGEGTDTEGHLNATWDDVVVGFYVLVYDRFARVFAVDVDISASLSIYVDPAEETLQIAIVDGPNIDGFSERYNELLPGVRFDEVLASLVSLAFDSLLGDDLGFSYDIANALSSALGVPLYVDFQGLETVPNTGTREFVNVYLSLTDTQPQPLLAAVPRAFQLDEHPGVLRLPDLPRARPAPTGEVRVRASDLMLTPEHEVFVQIDFGPWRGPLRPASDGVLTIDDPKLALVGEHRLDFRTRRAGSAGFLTPSRRPVKVWVDGQKPWAELAIEDDALVARGRDVGSLPADLVFAWSFDGDDWGEFADQRRVPLEDVEDVRRVSVRARDLAGNVSNPVTIDLGSERAIAERFGRTDRLAVPDAIGGCAQTTGASFGTVGLLGGLLAVLGLARRRRRRR